MEEIIKNILGIPHIIIENGVIDNLLLADSFIFNKLKATTGHGEARLYVGPTTQVNDNFFEGFQYQGFFIKNDLLEFMIDAKIEYMLKEQSYRVNITDLYDDLIREIERIQKEKIYFAIESAVGAKDGKRYYIRSHNPIWELMRRITLPNLSYISIMKVINPQYRIEFYFKIFMSYEYNSMNHPKLLESENISLSDSYIVDEKQSNLRQARVGQGEYRKKLLQLMPFCPITMVSDERFLIASHIKPWVKSDAIEKIDPLNGFMFTPNIDKLFDQGFISFSEDSRMLVSPWVSPMNRKNLGIIENKEYQTLQIKGKRIVYLDFHRTNIFKS